MRTSLRALALVLPALLLAAPAADAKDLWGGVRFGYYTEVEEPFVGGELLLRIDHRVFFNPNLEWVFVDNGSYYTVNADFHYDFPTHGDLMVWAGAGLAVVVVDPEGENNSDTDLGANFLFGLGLRGHSVIPYFQAKIIAKDNTEGSLAVGLRF